MIIDFDNFSQALSLFMHVAKEEHARFIVVIRDKFDGEWWPTHLNQLDNFYITQEEDIVGVWQVYDHKPIESREFLMTW